MRFSMTYQFSLASCLLASVLLGRVETALAAPSPDCQLINGQSRTISSNAPISIGPVVLNAGESINFSTTNVNAVRVDVNFAATTVQLAPGQLSQTIIVGSTGPTTTSAINLSPAGYTGPSFTITITCTGATSPGSTSSSGPLPDASSTGSIADVLVNGLQNPRTVPGIQFVLAGRMPTPPKTVARPAPDPTGLRGLVVDVSTEKSRRRIMNRAVAELRLLADEGGLGLLAAFMSDEELVEVMAIVPDTGPRADKIHAAVARYREAANGGRSAETVQNYAANSQTDQPKAFDLVMSGSDNAVSGTAVYRGDRVKNAWAFYASTNYSGSADDRRNVGSTAHAWSLTAGFAQAFGPQSWFDVSTTLRLGRAEADLYDSNLEGRYFGVNGRIGHQLGDHWTSSVMFSYLFGQNDLTIAGLTGEFDSHQLSSQIELSGLYQYGQMQIAPTILASLARQDRASFQRSDGLAIGASSGLTLSGKAGVSVSRSFFTDGFARTVTPSLGVALLAQHEDRDKAYLINGQALTKTGFGGELQTGLSLDLVGGGALQLNSSYSLLSNDIQNWSLGGQMKIPLN